MLRLHPRRRTIVIQEEEFENRRPGSVVRRTVMAERVNDATRCEHEFPAEKLSLCKGRSS
jgi:hypothetical protein